MPGILYLIPNTLGTAGAETNDSLSLVVPEEVLKITARIEYFIAENAKTTRAYLKQVSAHYPLAKPMQQLAIAELNVNTEIATLPQLLEPLLNGQDAGLISEAGVPAVADPGANLVRLAHRNGIMVKPLVGPSSLLLAVMASGLNGQSFAFNGYLPTDPTQRAKQLKQLEDRSRKERQTQLFIETPYRNIALLEAMASSCQPTTLICTATDLTLPTESIHTQTATSWKKALNAGKAPDMHKRPTVFLLLAE